MPQWQGGNNPIYYLGAQLLCWLAPKGDADFAEVPVAAPDGSQLPLEGGVLGKSAILKQNEAALNIIHQSAPDRIVTFGGDCSVSLAPFSYLASRYVGDVAVLCRQSSKGSSKIADPGRLMRQGSRSRQPPGCEQ
jgi:arginase